MLETSADGAFLSPVVTSVSQYGWFLVLRGERRRPIPRLCFTHGFGISQDIIWWFDSNPVPRSSQFMNTDQIYVPCTYDWESTQQRRRMEFMLIVNDLHMWPLRPSNLPPVFVQWLSNSEFRQQQTAADSHYSRARLRRVATVALGLTVICSSETSYKYT
jgi:hypothetical protein